MTINPQRPGLGLIGLDDGPEAYAALDPSGLGARLRALPRQCQAAWTHSQSFDWSAWVGLDGSIGLDESIEPLGFRSARRL